MNNEGIFSLILSLEPELEGEQMKPPEQAEVACLHSWWVHLLKACLLMDICFQKSSSRGSRSLDGIVGQHKQRH